MRNCKQCNKDITHRPPHAIYCVDPLCARIHRRNYQPTLQCLNCNKDYKPLPYRWETKFCTVSCSTKYAGKMRTNGQRENNSKIKRIGIFVETKDQ